MEFIAYIVTILDNGKLKWMGAYSTEIVAFDAATSLVQGEMADETFEPMWAGSLDEPDGLNWIDTADEVHITVQRRIVLNHFDIDPDSRGRGSG